VHRGDQAVLLQGREGLHGEGLHAAQEAGGQHCHQLRLAGGHQHPRQLRRCCFSPMDCVIACDGFFEFSSQTSYVI